MRTLPLLPLLAITAAVLSGCSSPAATSGTIIATFRTLDELKAAYVSAGGTCAAWSEDDDVRAAAQSGTCAGGIRLSTFLNGADLLSQVQVLRDTASSTDDGSGDAPRTELLIGTNWLASGPHARRVQSKLGGHLAVVNPSASN